MRSASIRTIKQETSPAVARKLLNLILAWKRKSQRQSLPAGFCFDVEKLVTKGGPDSFSASAVAEKGLAKIRSFLTAKDRNKEHAKAVVQASQYVTAFGGCGPAASEFTEGLFLVCAATLLQPLDVSFTWLYTGQFRLVNALQDEKPTPNSDELVALLCDILSTVSLPVMPELRAGTGKQRTAALSLRLTDEQFFECLDLSGTGFGKVRKALEAGDVAKARRQYAMLVAARLRYLEKMKWVRHPLEKNQDRVVAEADELLQNVITFRVHMVQRHKLGKTINWSNGYLDDIETTVHLNGHVMFGVLGLAYERTRNEKYIAKICQLLSDWYERAPVPNYSHGWPWNRFLAGLRTGERWPSTMGHCLRSRMFREKCLFAMAKSYLENARYLVCCRSAGNNKLFVESSGLAIAAILFPEFKEALFFAETARLRLNWGVDKFYLPDGFESECSPSYHTFPTRLLSNLVLVAKAARKTLREKWIKRFPCMLQVFHDIARPDFHLPILNDGGVGFNDVRPYVNALHRLYGRKSVLYLASSRKKGKPPRKRSCSFPYAGFYVMRSGWRKDDEYLVFDAGYFGSGHQHEDKLNFEIYAAGRPLIVDPGIYQYKQDEFLPYWRSSRGHNTVLVDGLGQCRRLQRKKEELPDPKTRWIDAKSFSFAEGMYADGYAPITEDGPILTGITHRRRIFYVKPGYFVIQDVVSGGGVHELEYTFCLAPVIRGPSKRQIESGKILIDDSARAVTTNCKGLGNIHIVPGEADGLKVKDYCGVTKPFVRGFRAYYGKIPAHDIVYSQKTSLPCVRHFFLFPLAAGSTDTPIVKRLQKNAGKGKANYFSVTGQGWKDTLFISSAGISKFACSGFSGKAEIFHARHAAGRRKVIARGLNIRGLQKQLPTGDWL